MKSLSHSSSPVSPLNDDSLNVPIIRPTKKQSKGKVQKPKDPYFTKNLKGRYK
jgi:hypothetical protein